MKPLIICGMPGSGKSTVAKELALNLKLKYLDLDAYIEEKTNSKISILFAKNGESFFRDLEFKYLTEILSLKLADIIALGGGALTLKKTNDLCVKKSILIYLKVDLLELEKRLKNQIIDRPLFKNVSLKLKLNELFSERKTNYEKATLTLDANQTTNRIIEQIKKALNGLNKRKYLQIKLKESSYPLIVQENCLQEADTYLQSYLRQHSHYYIISQENIFKLYAKHIINLLGANASHFLIPQGEKSKSYNIANLIYTDLLKNKRDRRTCIIALGGGIVGDLAGFVAATYQRGIAFIQIPTSLLAQVDSSIGGKVALNHDLGKNMIGAFYQPKAVIIDTHVLKTLHKDELICGVAEIVKASYIYSKKFNLWLKKNIQNILNLEAPFLQHAIIESLKIKKYFVESDEKEENIRAYLNFGHTFAHAFEKLSNHKIKHGQAVLLGMVCALFISKELNTESDFNYLEEKNFLLSLYQNKVNFNNDLCIEIMLGDKKNEDNEIVFILLKNISEVYKQKVDKSLVYKALAELKI